MNTTPVTLASTRQSNVDNSRFDRAQQDFNSAIKSVDQDFGSGSKAQSLINIDKTGDTSRGEIERQLRSVSMGNDARNPAPVSLSRQSNSWVEAGSTGWEPPTARRDASNDDATTTTMGRTSRSDDQRRTDEKVRSDDERGSDDKVRPVILQSSSNVTPSVLQNVGSIGASNGQSALFVYDGEVASVESITNALNKRFPDGNITAGDLTEMFNVKPDRAEAFLDRHHTLGDPDNMSVDALMRHVSRWQDEDGNLTQSRFEAAIVNGASHINVNRFEHEETKGFEFRGFLEMYRRSGGTLPEEALATIYNRYKDLDLKGDDNIAERSELVAMGIRPNVAGDVPVAEVLKAFNVLAYGEQTSPSTAYANPTSKQDDLPKAEWNPQKDFPTTGTPTYSGTPHYVFNQHGNIQNNIGPHGGPTSISFPNTVLDRSGRASTDNEWQNGNYHFRNRAP